MKPIIRVYVEGELRRRIQGVMDMDTAPLGPTGERLLEIDAMSWAVGQEGDRIFYVRFTGGVDQSFEDFARMVERLPDWRSSIREVLVCSNGGPAAVTCGHNTTAGTPVWTRRDGTGSWAFTVFGTASHLVGPAPLFFVVRRARGNMRQVLRNLSVPKSTIARYHQT